mgnify:CR=1 FL=1
MSLSRRKFLQHTALTAAGSALLSKGLMAAMPSGNALSELTGVQLYSIRDDMQKDPMGTLKALSKMGYKHVEHANYVNRKFYGWSAKEFKKVLEEKGGFIAAHWDGTAEEEEQIKEETKATIRCIPLDAEEEQGISLITGKPSTKRVLFAKAY